MCYEGAVDTTKLEDSAQRKGALDQIHNFGQIPVQLFTKKHIGRNQPREESQLQNPIKTISNSIGGLTRLKSNANLPIDSDAYCFTTQVRSFDKSLPLPIIHMKGIGDYLITLFSDGVLGINRWSNSPDGKGLPFTIEPDKTASLINSRVLDVLIPDDPSVTSNFALGLDGKILFHSGFWDNGVKVINTNSAQVVSSAYEHDDMVTCMDIGEDGRMLITGSNDTSVRIWNYGEEKKSRWGIDKIVKGTPNNSLRPIATLIGHDDSIVCVAINTDLGIIVSGSKDKTMIQYTTDGRYVRSINHPSSVNIVKISCTGQIISYCHESSLLFSHYINGQPCGKEVANHLCQMLITKDGMHVVTADEDGNIVIRNTDNLEIVKQFENTKGQIRSMTFTYEDDIEKYLLIGSQEGRITIFKLGGLEKK